MNAQQAAVLDSAEFGIPEATLVERHGGRQVRTIVLHFQWVRRGAHDIMTLTDAGKMELYAWRHVGAGLSPPR